MLTDLVRRDMLRGATDRPGDPVLGEVIPRYVVGAYMSVLTWWLDTGAVLPARQIDGMLRRLTFKALR
jgi:hypothetical protein